MVTQLPYSVKYPIYSPSGKAVFQIHNEAHTGDNTLFVDLVVCRFPEPGNLHIPDGTVTAYRLVSSLPDRQCWCLLLSLHARRPSR